MSVDNGEGGQKERSWGRKLSLIHLLKRVPNFVVQEAFTAWSLTFYFSLVLKKKIVGDVVTDGLLIWLYVTANRQIWFYSIFEITRTYDIDITVTDWHKVAHYMKQSWHKI